MFIKVAKNDFTRKRIILTPLQKLPKNVKDSGKLIVAKSFKKLTKVQKIAQSGQTVGQWCGSWDRAFAADIRDPHFECSHC